VGALGGVPQEAVALVGESVAPLGGVGAVEGAELLLVVVVGLRLDDPVVAVGRQRALVIEVVEVAEAAGERVQIRGDVLAELGIRRVSLTMITTCLIGDGSPILRGMTDGTVSYSPWLIGLI
jgi:hypothetical protein